MKFRLGTVNDIPIYVSRSLLVFFVVIFGLTFFFESLDEGIASGAYDTAILAGTFVLSYFIVTLHELGHSLTAQYFGHPVRDITLWPFAGFATIGGDWVGKPREHFWVTVNGPAVNYVLAVVGAITALFWYNRFVEHFILVNMTLLLFNLCPIYPMDGGRLLHVVITTLFPKATDDAIHYRTVYASVLFTLILAPLVATMYSGVAAVLLCVMGFVIGPSDLYFRVTERRREQEKQKHREERLAKSRTRYEEMAESKFPDDPIRRKEIVESLLLYDELMFDLSDMLVSRSDITVDEGCDIITKFHDYAMELTEDERIALNKRLNTENRKEVLWEVVSQLRSQSSLNATPSK